MNIVSRQNDEFEGLGLFELTADLVCVAGKDGYFRKVNQAVCKKLGYTEEELFSQPISSFVHPDDRDLTTLHRSRLLAGKPLINFENRYLKKNGDPIWLEWTSVYLPDKEIVFAIAKDISDRKKRETEIREKYKKFKNLATHFKSSLEEDRKTLATELHEELAQLASVVKMDIDWLSTNSKELPPSSRNRIENTLAISDLLVSSIRRISYSLRSNILDDFGLNASLETLCTDFAILHGIPCTFQSSYGEGDLAHEIKLDFFRICQEALTNVMHRAGAREVNIILEDADDKIILTIRDDGKGFSDKEQMQTPGLTRMRERANSINGEFMIHSKIGKGTSICLAVRKDQNSEDELNYA